MQSTSFIFFLFILFSNCLSGQNFEEELKKAVTNYQNQNYSQSIRVYQSILNEGYFHPDLFNNLGNAYYKSGQLDQAILTYERGLLTSPRHKDLIFNLKVANQHQTNKLEPIAPFFLTKFWRNLEKMFSVTAWSILGICFLWGSFGSWSIWLLGKTRTTKKRGFYLGIILAFFAGLCFILAQSHHHWQYNNPYGVITTHSIPLRSAPDKDNNPIMDLYEGLKVQRLDKIENWIKVRLEDGEVGWIPDNALTMI